VDDVLVTPPLESGCLAGITRDLLLQWSAAEGLPVKEQALPFDVLHDVDEVLLTSSTRNVQPVSGLDGRPLRHGELARTAVELFTRRSREEPDPV
jgi:branched-chain amino acid aminotransferase